VIAHKFLRRGALGLLTREAWPQPSADGAPGAWVELLDGPLVPCRRGLHACRIEQLGYWLADELWQVELDGEHLDTQHSVVARRMRLLRRVHGWEGAAGQAFADACTARAQEALAAASSPPPLASEYLEQMQAFARLRNRPLTAYAAALAVSALAPGAEAMSAFDAERRLQGRTLAQLAGLTPGA
jgi:hypothetical protein